MRGRSAGATYGAKIPAPGEAMESDHRLDVPVVRYEARTLLCTITSRVIVNRQSLQILEYAL